MQLQTSSEKTELKTFTLKNSKGMQIEVLNYGGIVSKLMVPDQRGQLGDVLLGFDQALDFVNVSHPYFNALIGRFANRIANGEIQIQKWLHHLPQNNGRHTLHGGLKGFDKVYWNITELSHENKLRLMHLSPSGDQGFPGNLRVTVDYTLTEDNEWRIDYKASTDQPTFINLTQHAYFNLTGQPANSILNHVLSIDANEITGVDHQLIPTGEFLAVDNSPFDFRIPRHIGEKIKEVPMFGGGFDHNWVLNGEVGFLKKAAQLYDPLSGRIMDVFTTEPGLQFYSGNFLDGTLKGKRGVRYQKHAGCCLETQHFPDSMHHPGFPSTLLRPGEIFSSTTVYRFDKVSS